MTLRKRYLDAINHIFELFTAPTPEFKKDYATLNLIENPTALFGPPGVGKTALITITAKVLFGDEAAVVHLTESKKPEDVFFEMDISLKNDGKTVQRYEFKPMPREAMTKPIVFFNEFNRANDLMLDELLSYFEEGEVYARGVMLKRVRSKVWLDYNPYKNTVDYALITRIAGSINVHGLELPDEALLLERKFSKRSIEKLCDLAETKLTKEDMYRIWDEVKKVKVSAEAASSASLFMALFKACVHDIDSLIVERPCDECEIRENCLLAELEQPLHTRNVEHIVMLMKARAWLEGRDEVQVKYDLEPAIKLAISHKVLLKDDTKREYMTYDNWFEGSLKRRLQEVPTIYTNTAKIIEMINKERTPSSRIKMYTRARDRARDPLTLKILKETVGNAIIADSKKKMAEKIAELIKMKHTDYTEDEVTKIDESELLPEHRDKITEEKTKLLEYLKATVTVGRDRLGDIAKELTGVDMNAAMLMKEIIEGVEKGVVHITKSNDAGTVTVDISGTQAQISFRVKRKAVADVFWNV